VSALDEAGPIQTPGRPTDPWTPLVHDWLPVWLAATGFELAAEEVRNASPEQASSLVDELFQMMQDEVANAIETWIDPDDQISEPMAVLESSEYILSSLPASWIDFVRAGRLAGRAALVAQMALFATLVRMAATPAQHHLDTLVGATERAYAAFAG
jgi:hypothetical protein